MKEATKGNFECTYFKQLVKEWTKSPNGTRYPRTRYFWFFQFRSVESDMQSPHWLVVHMNIFSFRPKGRRISEVNLKGGWVLCRRKRWSASPALGLLVIFKRTKLLPAIFLCGLSWEHTFGDCWYRTNRLVCNFYILDFMNFTPKSVPDNCLQTYMSNTRGPKGRNFKHMAEYF